MIKFKIPSEVKSILETFVKEGYQIYIVGGAVRDLILEREVYDWDFTTDATPEQILKVIPDGFYNNQFGTVGVNSLSGVFEITTMRREGDYKDSRHPSSVNWTTRIEEDLARRDFTINALALSPKLEITDPFGGQNDLESKQIKAVGDADKRFNEDALRLIRAIRIATQLEFEVEPKTLAAIKKNAGLIKKIASERIRDELFKLIVAPHAYKGLVLLKETDLLEQILPELQRCFGIAQEGPKHDREYDIGEHNLQAMQNTPSSDPIVRLAALLHDVGKPDTVNTQEDGNVTFYNHEVVGSRIGLAIAKRFNLSNKQSDKLFRLIRWHMFTLDEKQTDSAIRRFIKNVGQENIDCMMAVRIGDRLGGGTQNAVSWRMKEFKKRIDQVLHKPFSVTDLKINGGDVMETLKIPPSRRVGEILDKLFKEVLADETRNNRDYLIGKIKSMA